MHVIVISFKSYDLSLKCGSHSWTCDDFTLQRIDDQMLPGEQINPTIYFALDQSFDLPATVMIETVNADPWIELSTFWISWWSCHEDLENSNSFVENAFNPIYSKNLLPKTLF